MWTRFETLRSLWQRWAGRAGPLDPKTQRLKDAMQHDPTLVAVRAQIRKLLFESDAGIAALERDAKRALAADGVAKSMELLESEQPQQATRNWLIEKARRTAMYGVLIMPPEPEEDVTGLRSLSGVSGALKAQLDRLIELNFQDDLQILGGKAEVHDAIVLRYWTEYFYLCLANIVRIGVGDRQEPDWYNDLVYALYALQEHHYRLQLQCPVLLDDQALLAITEFIAAVCRGDASPRLLLPEGRV